MIDVREEDVNPGWQSNPTNWREYDEMIHEIWDRQVVLNKQNPDEQHTFSIGLADSPFYSEIIHYASNRSQSFITLRLFCKNEIFQCVMPLMITINGNDAAWFSSLKYEELEAFSCLAHYVNLTGVELKKCGHSTPLDRTFEDFSNFLGEYLLAMVKMLVMPDYQHFQTRWEAYFHLLLKRSIGTILIGDRYLCREGLMESDAEYLKSLYKN